MMVLTGMFLFAVPNMADAQSMRSYFSGRGGNKLALLAHKGWTQKGGLKSSTVTNETDDYVDVQMKWSMGGFLLNLSCETIVRLYTDNNGFSGIEVLYDNDSTGSNAFQTADTGGRMTGEPIIGDELNKIPSSLMNQFERLYGPRSSWSVSVKVAVIMTYDILDWAN